MVMCDFIATPMLTAVQQMCRFTFKQIQNSVNDCHVGSLSHDQQQCHPTALAAASVPAALSKIIMIVFTAGPQIPKGVFFSFFRREVILTQLWTGNQTQDTIRTPSGHHHPGQHGPFFRKFMLEGLQSNRDKRKKKKRKKKKK